MPLELTVADTLPEDRDRAVLVGRAWLPGAPGGPAVVTVRGDRVVDITGCAPTCSELLNRPSACAMVRNAAGRDIGSLADIIAASVPAAGGAVPSLLAPVDLQAVKACGVTFADSMLERVIEERAKGDPSAADAIRSELRGAIGVDLGAVVPGSPEAARLKDMLVERGMWSQYLEVGIGPDAEVFTKAQPMSAVGTGAEIGIHSASSWNNPEPEIVLVVNARGETVGATLGNDVNLLDIEGRSALLLGKAKDNNASAAIGPFIRLFDDDYGIDDVRSAELALRVSGPDGFVLDGASSMSRISRDPLALVAETIGAHHQYPDGVCLMTGTLFSPTKDRDAPGGGFTHKVGDVVRISTPRLGTLANRVNHSEAVAPWTFGTGALMRNLAERGLL